MLRLRRYEFCSKLSISLQRESVDPKFQVKGVAPPTILFLRKQGKLSFVLYKNINVSFFRFVTIHAFDGRTDRQTEFFIVRPRLHSTQRGKNRSFSK